MLPKILKFLQLLMICRTCQQLEEHVAQTGGKDWIA